MNGHKPLSAAQQRHLTRLITTLERTQAAAQHAQANANDFLGYCAEELGVKVGADGWTFDQQAMAFVQEQGEAKIDKKLPVPDKVAERNGAA